MRSKTFLSILILMLVLLSMVFAACSNDDLEEQAEQPEDAEQEENQEDQEGLEDQDTAADQEEADTDAEEEDTASGEAEDSDEHIEHQTGLQIGETGTVVSREEEYTYEVTLNSVRYEEELDDLRLFGDVFVVADVTIENVDNQSFAVESVFTPSLGELDSTEYHSSTDNEFLEGISDIDLMEGELAPGDSITGQYVFDMETKEENYHFAFGTDWDQITTYAQWAFSADEVE